MSTTDLSKALSAAHSAADGAKDILQHYFGKVKQVDKKVGEGLVSEADRESERFIRASLAKQFSKVNILGEEEGLKGERGAKELWVIDPLDGTHNYICGLPIYCISIGFEVDNEPVLGLIDVPALNQRFWAVKGQGAFLNNEPIKVANVKSISEILVGTGFAYQNGEEIDRQLGIFREILHKSLGVRRPGAAAYDLALVACGAFGAFWEKGLKPWDSSAGTCLIREAGGVVSNYKGERYMTTMTDLVAGASNLHHEVLSVIKSLSKS